MNKNSYATNKKKQWEGNYIFETEQFLEFVLIHFLIILYTNSPRFIHLFFESKALKKNHKWKVWKTLF
jgi:hypothetical protein